VKLKASVCLALVAVLALPGAHSPAALGSSTAVRVLHLVDRSRTIRLPNGREAPRPVTTYVRVPASGAGPWPLIVFGHGYAVTPGIYARLLQAWVRAGYVVAAPLFPLGNKYAAGGPNESDIVNQPRDISFVISQVLAANASPGNPLRGLIDGSHIAVAGQSDGGETAFAAAYEPLHRDARIDAAVILSGAQLPGDPFRFPKAGVPLLAAQGTADRINRPSYTYDFYDAARRPKFLLRLPGAGHLGPYTSQEPQLDIVERVTTAFLDRYLKQGSTHAIITAGSVRGIAQLSASP
jgi:dienelactone hydrolase